MQFLKLILLKNFLKFIDGFSVKWYKVKVKVKEE